MKSTQLLSIVEKDLRRDEGVRSKPYRDTEGFLTIGVGHNLDVEGLCPEAIDAQLRYDIRTKAIEPLERYLPWYRECPDPVKRVLINLMFNMGPKTLLGFHNTLAFIKKGDYSRAASHLLQSKYARQVGDRAERLAALLREAELVSPPEHS